jgi:predicted ATPase
MLTRVTLEHFKCFEFLKLPLAPLTLLTGLNAAGKSTVIQALTLLHQTLNESPDSQRLVLNGKDVSLGSADEVVDKVSGRDSFAIGVDHDAGGVLWRMQVKANAMAAPFVVKSDHLHDALIQTLRTLTYISADRIGPRETYPVNGSTQQTSVGARGEYTPWFIHAHADLTIPESMCSPGVPPPLKRQVEAWLASFFPGSAIEIEPIPRTNLLVMRMRTSAATNFHRMANVGYGLSHVLPVITACLGAVGLAQHEARIAPLVMVENPELHLHPAGQSAMGVFLTRAAASGAQVLVETHSDHVLNGIRRAVKGVDGSPILQPEQVAIHFFQRRDDSGKRPQVISPIMDPQGYAGVAGVEPSLSSRQGNHGGCPNSQFA